MSALRLDTYYFTYIVRQSKRILQNRGFKRTRVPATDVIWDEQGVHLHAFANLSVICLGVFFRL